MNARFSLSLEPIPQIRDRISKKLRSRDFVTIAKSGGTLLMSVSKFMVTPTSSRGIRLKTITLR